jgi:alkylation response protein AidB-like acyl-CoA dehydrogenase
VDALLRSLVDLSSPPPATDALDAWWSATEARRGAWDLPVERALAAGACADRLGFAFAGGYAAALDALVPDRAGTLTALCATEEGGNHPRAIQAALTRDGDSDGYRLTGRKRWATMATAASHLLVVASTGVDADGKNRLRVARVATDTPGVRLFPATAPFAPEIPHAEVELDAVAVAADDVLPGDGYDAYLKPFRTVEDLHVHAALLGYLIGVTRRHRLAPELTEQLLALAITTRALAAVDAAAATTHLALAGLIELVTGVIVAVERAWAAVPDDELTRWQRDRPLLQVAGKARAARRERARGAI